MPESPQSWETTVDKAAEILGVSTRTVRRYAKDGKIDHRRVQGQFGEELRFNEEELWQLAKVRSNGIGNGRQQAADSPRHNGNLDAQAVWQAYQELQVEYRNAAAQIGFLQSRAEEVPKLTERAESLQKQKEEAEQAKATTEKEKEKLTKELEAERHELEQTRRRMVWSTIAYIILTMAIAAFLIILSPNYSEFIANLLKL